MWPVVISVWLYLKKNTEKCTDPSAGASAEACPAVPAALGLWHTGAVSKAANSWTHRRSLVHASNADLRAGSPAGRSAHGLLVVL